MAEELSPESKLYVKEEIERTKREFKEDLEKAQSKATKTFATIALVVGLLGSLGIYGLAKKYIETTVTKNLGSETLAEIEDNKTKAQVSCKKTAEYETDAKKILDSLSHKTLIGTIVPYGGEIKDSGEPNEIREGWLFCNGAPLKKSGEYAGLFRVIGTAFGEPDDSTFNLPDLRGRFVRGVDHGAGRDPNSTDRNTETNGNTGDAVGSLQDDEFKSHSHKGLGRVHTQCKSGPDHYRPIPGPTDPAGGKETRPKNIYVNWIIKAK